MDSPFSSWQWKILKTKRPNEARHRARKEENLIAKSNNNEGDLIDNIELDEPDHA